MRHLSELIKEKNTINSVKKKRKNKRREIKREIDNTFSFFIGDNK